MKGISSKHILYVVEFIDVKMRYPKTLELRIKENELLNI